MNTRGLPRQPLSILLIACAIMPLLLSACQPANASTSLPPTATQTPSSPSVRVTLDLSGLAQAQTVETVAAVPASAGGFWTGVMPQHTLLTLQGYPVAGSVYQPQIFIYPVADLAGFNETAGKIAVDLQALLQTRQAGDPLPFLPLLNAKQMLHPQVQYLDFKNGKGVRFLTWYSQGFMRITNPGLIYTFQGLTGDGKYYIAAVLPVSHPELPRTEQVFTQSNEELKNYLPYVTKTIAWLEQQPGSSFTPDLAKLDALVQSIEVK